MRLMPFCFNFKTLLFFAQKYKKNTKLTHVWMSCGSCTEDAVIKLPYAAFTPDTCRPDTSCIHLYQFVSPVAIFQIPVTSCSSGIHVTHLHLLDTKSRLAYWRRRDNNNDIQIYGYMCKRGITLVVMSGPSAPRQLTWLVVGSNGVHLSWMPPAEPNGVVTSYIISYCSGDAETASLLTTAAANCYTKNVHGQFVVDTKLRTLLIIIIIIITTTTTTHNP